MLLVVIVLLVIGFGCYVYVTNSGRSAEIGESQTTAPNLPGSSQSTAPTEIQNDQWLIYENPELGFQMKYPEGSELNDVDVTGGRSIYITSLVNKVAPLLQIDVKNQEYGNNGPVLQAAHCDSERRAGTRVSINGIDFTKTDVSGDYGGMESASIAQSYCTMNAGIKYNIVARISYNRYKGPSPDKGIYFPQFDQWISALDFRFIAAQTTSEDAIVKRLISGWKPTQSRFSRKAGESGTYNSPDRVQFIAPNVLLVHYDDGLVDLLSVLQFNEGTFSETEVLGSMSRMPSEQWKAVVQIYGDPNYSPQNYEEGIYPNLVRVPENVFVE